MTKIVINADDTPEEIERKVEEGFAGLRALLEAWHKAYDVKMPGTEEDQ